MVYSWAVVFQWLGGFTLMGVGLTGPFQSYCTDSRFDTLKTRSRVYPAVLRSTPLYGCDMRPLRVADEVVDNGCLRSTPHNVA